jgi:hypothetical protein
VSELIMNESDSKRKTERKNVSMNESDWMIEWMYEKNLPLKFVITPAVLITGGLWRHNILIRSNFEHVKAFPTDPEMYKHEYPQNV